MQVEYWAVESASPSPLSFDCGQISAHLQEDWIPSFPATISRAVVGWPPFLTEPVEFGGVDFLALKEVAGFSDRQWKGMVSWMLGVAGARHILKTEGYQWVAPLSAFYDNAVQKVDLSGWNPAFPRSVVSATALAGSTARLRPDYVALRSLAAPGSYDWAIAEAKGTSWCLTKAAQCPVGWYTQVRNVELTVMGAKLTIPRHLVVATRVNPNARRPATRRLQVRAWNSEQASDRIPASAAADIAAAHLYGILRNLGLRTVALGLALAVERRAGHHASAVAGELHRVQTDADRELRGMLQTGTEADGRWTTGRTKVETELGTIAVEIEPGIVSLAAALTRAETPSEAAHAMEEAEARLADWRGHRAPDTPDPPDTVTSNCGITYRFPEVFYRR
jgi:hypothetical protein